MKRALAILIVSAVLAVPASADLFFDDFNSENGGTANPSTLNYNTFANWTVTDGTVDLIGNGYFDWFGGTHGLYVDLDGSTGNAGKMTTTLSLDPGEYTLQFDLAGNHRNTGSEQVTVKVDAGPLFEDTYSLNMNDPFATFTETFTVVNGGTYSLSFAGAGGDNIGMLLDNVRVNPVPVPGAVLLGMLGLSAAGLKLRKRS